MALWAASQLQQKDNVGQIFTPATKKTRQQQRETPTSSLDVDIFYPKFIVIWFSDVPFGTKSDMEQGNHI